MEDRRNSKGLRIADMSIGYIRFVRPELARELWYMLSEDNRPFLPIESR